MLPAVVTGEVRALIDFDELKLSKLRSKVSVAPRDDPRATHPIE
jgi:hypothetical protein